MTRLQVSPHTTLLSVIRELTGAHAERPALIGEGEQLSFRALVDRADSHAAWAASQQVEPGEVIGLLMPNCPDYAALWLGLGDIGCVVALLNASLLGDALAHAVRASGARRIIVGASLLQRVRAIETLLAPGTRIMVHADTRCASPPSLPPVPGRGGPARGDRALLIGTSGTTGLPKWAALSHRRVLEWSTWFAGLMDVRPEDRLYDCLPMYHSIGGVVAVGSMLCRGASVVVRERFSASRFWPDVVLSGCTIFQYIGELCRILAAAPSHPFETAHGLRLCCGNGLHREVWPGFEQRFRIPRILEFYAATEGHVSLYNMEGRPGAIGRIPGFLAQRQSVALIRLDLESGEPQRGPDGLCVRCATGEPGEAIGAVRSPVSPQAPRFDGYTDAAASSRKLLRDVFVRGDCWFRTGDLMRRDDDGFYSFVDRLGDTYRWKGENVSTTEVAATIASSPGIDQAIVFGVAIPGGDGRAGMAAITCREGFEFPLLRQHLARNLPPYAHPLFVRICPMLPSTGTFRPIKRGLAQAGLSLDPEHGALWFNDRHAGGFVAADATLLRRLDDGLLPL